MSAQGAIPEPVDAAIAAHTAAADPHGDRAYALGQVNLLAASLGSAAFVNTSAFDTAGTAAAAVATHEADTTSVHGIADTSALYRSGGTDVAVADGGTGASDAATARTNLGAIGGSLGGTDNALLRADGTGGATAQGSPGGGFPATLSDANVLTLPVSGSTLALNPANGAVTLGQTWAIILSTNNNFVVRHGTGQVMLVSPQDANYGKIHLATAGTIVGVGLHGGNGFLELNNGTAGQYRDLLLRNLTASGPVSAGTYTFATVPSALTFTGSAIRITDRSGKWAYSDGTNWRFFGDDSVIS